MTNPDFAELKDKLTSFVCDNAHDDFHVKNSAIITELLDIIQIQSEALEVQPRFDASQNPPRETYAFREAQQSLSETNTRLQKLKENK